MTDVCSHSNRSTRHSTSALVLLVVNLVCVLTQQGSTGLGVQELMTRLAE